MTPDPAAPRPRRLRPKGAARRGLDPLPHRTAQGGAARALPEGDQDAPRPGGALALPRRVLPGVRVSLAFTVQADLFIPAGGRPETIDRENWERYLLPDGTPSARAIVEGANSFITPEARVQLQRKGVIIMRDASANKCGVISSSYEIIANLTARREGVPGQQEPLREGRARDPGKAGRRRGQPDPPAPPGDRAALHRDLRRHQPGDQRPLRPALQVLPGAPGAHPGAGLPAGDPGPPARP